MTKRNSGRGQIRKTERKPIVLFPFFMNNNVQRYRYNNKTELQNITTNNKKTKNYGNEKDKDGSNDRHERHK